MTTSADTRPLLTILEAAARLHLSTSTVRRRIWDGELPAVRLGLRPQAPVGIDPAELERWISSSKRPAGAGESGRSPHGGLEART